MWVSVKKKPLKVSLFARTEKKKYHKKRVYYQIYSSFLFNK